jgi:hypothetical protein
MKEIPDVSSHHLPAILSCEKAGLVKEGTLRGAVVRDDGRQDRILIGPLRDEGALRAVSSVGE